MKDARRSLRIAAEGVAMIALLWLIDARFAGGDAFAGINPNPYWIPVLAMTLAYGSWPGLAAAVGASLCWLTATHPGLGTGEDPFDHIVALSMPPMLWVATSAALGEVTSTRLRRLERLSDRSRKLDANLARLAEGHARLAGINRDLQVRAAIEDRGVGEAIATAADLLEPQHANLARTVARLVEIAAQSDDFTLYLRRTGAWRRFTGGGAADPTRILPAALADAMADRTEALHVGDAADRVTLGDFALLALPLRAAENDPAFGILVFHSLALPRFTRRMLIDFADIAAWLSLILVRTGQLDRPVQPGRLRIVGSDVA